MNENHSNRTSGSGVVPQVAVAGCGYWGKNLVRNFHELGALALVCDATAEGRARAGGIAPGVSCLDRYEDLLEADVGAIVLATPAETHYDLAARALRAGKDVFVEKPLALTYEQGAELLRLGAQAQRMIVVGHVLEYHPAILRLLELIHEGELGRIHYIYSNRLSLGKIRREENILWSFAPHDIAIILRIMNAMPFQVAAWGGSYVQPNIADVTVSNLLFDNGVRAHIHVSWLHPFKEHRLVVIGSKKMISFDDVAKKLLLYDQRVDVREGEPIPVKNQGVDVAFPGAEPLRCECEAFLEALRTRRPPRTDGESGLRVLKVLQAAQRSLIMNGEPVTLSPESFRPAQGAAV